MPAGVVLSPLETCKKHVFFVTLSYFSEQPHHIPAGRAHRPDALPVIVDISGFKPHADDPVGRAYDDYIGNPEEVVDCIEDRDVPRYRYIRRARTMRFVRAIIPKII